MKRKNKCEKKQTAENGHGRVRTEEWLREGTGSIMNCKTLEKSRQGDE